MKKLFSFLTLSVVFLSACGGGNDTEPMREDSLTRATDSIERTSDTSSTNRLMGDSTSESGSHGEGSGSRVGGGKTGEPQKGGSEKN